MITLKVYLQERFSKANALTRREAEIIGLKWPMEKGWVKKFGSVEISQDKMGALSKIAGARAEHMALCKMTRKARKLAEKTAKAAPVERAVIVVAARPVMPKEDFYRSREWRELRYKALVLHGTTCQCCGASRSNGAVLHVDHIKPRSKYPELELSLDNLQVLCEDCNMGKSNKDETDWRKP